MDANVLNLGREPVRFVALPSTNCSKMLHAQQQRMLRAGARAAPCKPLTMCAPTPAKSAAARPCPTPTRVPAQACRQSTAPRRTAVHCQASSAAAVAVPARSVGVVLLAGGVGKRMGASIPKQYLELKGQPIATYSLQTFGNMSEVSQIVIVCDPSWRYIFEERLGSISSKVEVKWALPGAERQDSVFNGLQEISSDAQIVAVHDSARPLVTAADVRKCMEDAATVGAAVLGVPVKPTIKEVDADRMVIQTLQRSKLWEVQTPQCIRPGLLRQGFQLVKDKGLEVTDDVSIIEAMGLPVKITAGSYTNIKVTTPDDMSVAEKFLDEVKTAPAPPTAAAAVAA